VVIVGVPFVVLTLVVAVVVVGTLVLVVYESESNVTVYCYHKAATILRIERLTLA